MACIPFISKNSNLNIKIKRKQSFEHQITYGKSVDHLDKTNFEHYVFIIIAKCT